MRLRSSIGGVLLLVACSGPTDDGELTRKLGSDLFSFGPHVQLAEPASGNVIAAGENVVIAVPVGGDALVAGEQLDLKGPFRADLYAAGGRITLDGEVAGSVRVAGGAVHFGPHASVGRGISIAASDVLIEGALHDYLQIGAATTRLNASVEGDVEVAGRTLEVGPSALIRGSLTFRGSNPPLIAPEARILGQFKHLALPPPPPVWFAWGLHLAGALLLALLGTLAFAVWPNTSRSLGQVAARSTGSALLVGAGILIAVPAVAFLALVSIIGAPLGLLALYLYVLFLPLGYLISAMALSDRLCQRWRPAATLRTAPRGLTLAVVLVLLGGLCSVPALGWLLGSLLSATGMGSAAILARQRFRARHPRTPSSARPPLEPDSLPHAG